MNFQLKWGTKFENVVCCIVLVVLLNLSVFHKLSAYIDLYSDNHVCFFRKCIRHAFRKLSYKPWRDAALCSFPHLGLHSLSECLMIHTPFQMLSTLHIHNRKLNKLDLTLCLQGNFACFFVNTDFFSKSTFSKNSFRNTIRVSNSLDPDQAQHFVGPDLCPICLQRLSADDKSRR